MKCADPILCYNDGQKKIYRHFSLASPIFKTIHNQVFNCGKCIFCRKRKSKELAVRCVLHASLYKENCFLTLTYDETHETYKNTLVYSHIQTFKRNLRRYCDYHHDKKIQIFNVHEYGKKGKKHWHLVIFNHNFSDKSFLFEKNGNKLYTSEQLKKFWPYGHNTIGDVSEASAMYQAQYTQKDFKHGNVTNEKKSHSKHSGIGRDYFLKHYEQILSLGYIPFGNQKIPIPRYFEKLAHKHYSHFYAPDNFIDTPERKKLYTPFKENQAQQKIADLFIEYYLNKEKIVEKLSEDWDATILPLRLKKQKQQQHLLGRKNAS